MTAIGIVAQATATGAGAPSQPEQMWLQSDWHRIAAEVNRLQMRIAKATMEGKWGRAHVLQHLLTRSHSGKMLAVKRVTENRGRRTPGVDGKIWSTPAAKWRGMQSMQHRSDRALPLRRIDIPTRNGASARTSVTAKCKHLRYSNIDAKAIRFYSLRRKAVVYSLPPRYVAERKYCNGRPCT